MQYVTILIQLLLLLETTVVTTGLFAKKWKTEKDDDDVIAKYDPKMPVRMRKVLNKIGDEPILKIELGRTPVKAGIVHVLNFLSKGRFHDKQLELGYDEIYHNYLLITIENRDGPRVFEQLNKNVIDNPIFKLEKAQRISLTTPSVSTDFVDVFDIPLTPNKSLTLNQLISTASNLDKQFYIYDAADNNMCQTFVQNIVDFNGLTSNIVDNATLAALKPQNAKELIATLGRRSSIVKSVTDTGGKVDTLLFDRIKLKIRGSKN